MHDPKLIQDLSEIQESFPSVIEDLLALAIFRLKKASKLKKEAMDFYYNSLPDYAAEKNKSKGLHENETRQHQTIDEARKLVNNKGASLKQIDEIEESEASASEMSPHTPMRKPGTKTSSGKLMFKAARKKISY